MRRAKWTAAEIPALSGKLAIVTGANSGLGLETTRELAHKGAKVILACRSRDKAEQAIEQLAAEGVARDLLEFGACDLSSLSSVREFAEAVRAEHPAIDLLINNAGVMALPKRETADGFEMQFGTNHLGHFALTGLLLDRLLVRAGSRVVTVSSLMHAAGRIDFEDLHGSRRYYRWLAYGQSKLANLLFSFELQRRLERMKRGELLSVAAHPGYSSTNLLRSGPQVDAPRIAARVFRLGNGLLAQDAGRGALPSLYAATAADVRGGEYFGPDGIGEISGHPKRIKARPHAYDRAIAEQLWQVSIEHTGVDFQALARSD